MDRVIQNLQYVKCARRSVLEQHGLLSGKGNFHACELYSFLKKLSENSPPLLASNSKIDYKMKLTSAKVLKMHLSSGNLTFAAAALPLRLACEGK